MIQQSPFPPVFTLERVTPAVEAALGAAMLHRARLEKQMQPLDSQDNRQISTLAAKMTLTAIFVGNRLASDVAKHLGISTHAASNRILILRRKGYVVASYRNGPGNFGDGAVYEYRLTDDGLQWLRAGTGEDQREDPPVNQ